MPKSARVAAVALALALTLPLPLLRVSPVFGHADYDHSTPNKDEVVQTPPTRIDVYFTQEVFREEGANYVRVFDEAETTQVSTGDGVIDDLDRTHVSAELPEPLGPGKYVVRWQTLSAEDQDQDSGGFCFYVQVQPTSEQQLACSALEAAGPTSTQVARPTATAPSTGEATPAATATVAGGEEEDGGGVSAGVVAGAIAAAVVVALVLASAGWYFIGRRQS